MAVAAKPGIPPRPVDPARLAAGRILHAVLEEGAYANLSSIRLLDRTDLNALDRRFASALIYGTLSRIITIDWLLDKVSRRPLSELEPWLRTILRLGVWQLRWSRSIPPSAAIDETVRLIRKMSNPGAAGYRQCRPAPAAARADPPAGRQPCGLVQPAAGIVRLSAQMVRAG